MKAIEVKRLPKGAIYDYTDVVGYDHYHTSKKTYLVLHCRMFGKVYKKIWSC